MASSSSSTSNIQRAYDLFISFRGADVRHTFLSHLISSLDRKQLLTFIDERLNTGQEISPSLFQAIEESTTSVIIFSENYPDSSCCLDELLHILHCRDTKGQFVLPVFYRVDPTHVEDQTGCFGDAFQKLKLPFKKNMDRVQRWSSALKKAANISGLDWSNCRPESRLAEKIAEYISKEVGRRRSSAISKGLVGIDSRVEEVLSLLRIESTDILFVGIWGMPGIGKTTTAEVLYHRISYYFDGFCFIRNIREESEKHSLTDILSKIISKVLNDKGIQIETVDALPTYIVDRLRRQKVLIVLDDVNDIEHLKLARHRDWLMPGSKVILTGRNRMLMNEADQIYEVKELQRQEACELFCLRAFKQKELVDGDYMQLSKRMLDYAKGVPLALNILGSLMYKKNKEVWKSKLRKLEKSPEKAIQKVLEISYDNLDEYEKKIFLDIACFFKGADICWLTGILDGCELFASDSISSLVDKCLITIVKNKVEMHDLLQDMGRKIAEDERSRLWIAEDVVDVLTYNTGTSVIEGMFLDISKIRNIELNPEAFLKINKLRLFKVYGMRWSCDEFPFCGGDLQFLPNTLSYLHWNYYPGKSLPPNFSMEKLVDLTIWKSQLEELWSEEKRPYQLKSLRVGHSNKLIELPNLSFATNIERIILVSCESLVGIPPSIQQLHDLNCLCIHFCPNLKSIPSLLNIKCLKIFKVQSCVSLEKISDIPENVEEFELDCCPRLTSFPSTYHLKFLKKLDISSVNLKKFPEIKSINLNYLRMEKTGIEELPYSIGYLSSLVHLDLHGNEGLQTLPSSIYKLTNLQFLNLNHCRVLEISSEIDKLSALKELYLSGNSFERIPKSIERISTLRILDVRHCKRLVHVPEVSSSVHHIDAAGCVSLETTSLCQQQQIYFQEFRLEDREEEESEFGIGYRLDMHAHLRRGYKFDFWNCVMLDENTYNNILANLQQRIQDLATKLPNFSNENHHEPQWDQLIVILPRWTENTVWFEYQNKSGSSIPTQQLSHDWSKSDCNFAGLTFLVLVEYVKGLFRFDIKCKCHFKINDGGSASFISVTSFNPPPEEDGLLDCDMIIWYENKIDGRTLCNINEASFEFEAIGFRPGTGPGFQLEVKKCGVHVVYTQDEIESIEPHEREREEAMKSNIIMTEYNNEINIPCSVEEEETNNANDEYATADNITRGSSSVQINTHVEESMHSPAKPKDRVAGNQGEKGLIVYKRKRKFDRLQE